MKIIFMTRIKSLVLILFGLLIIYPKFIPDKGYVINLSSGKKVKLVIPRHRVKHILPQDRKYYIYSRIKGEG